MGRVPVKTGFEGFALLQEGEDLVSHARRCLPPILSWEAEAIRRGDRIKQKQGAHGVVSSSFVSPSLSPNAWRGSRKMSGGRSGSCIVPRDQIPTLSFGLRLI
jgi:hypothetical protein